MPTSLSARPPPSCSRVCMPFPFVVFILAVFSLLPGSFPLCYLSSWTPNVLHSRRRELTRQNAVCTNGPNKPAAGLCECLCVMCLWSYIYKPWLLLRLHSGYLWRQTEAKWPGLGGWWTHCSTIKLLHCTVLAIWPQLICWNVNYHNLGTW